jgi:MFS family permease
VAQGLGAALLVPASLAILGTDFEGEARGRAIGTWAAAGAIAGAIGPILGGWLVDNVGWRSIFAVILPVAAAALLLGWKYIAPRGKDEHAARLDWAGAALATIGLGLVTWGLTRFANGGDAAAPWVAAAGVAACIGFVALEARLGDKAMVPLALFGTRTFTGVTLLTLFLYAALGGVLFLLPYLLIARGWPASAAGAAMLPLAIAMGLGSRGAGRLAERIGARPMLAIGPIVTGAGFAWMGRMPDGAIDYWFDVFPAMALIGIGMTIAVAPLTTTVMTAVDEHHAGAASGVNNATARIGMMLATALVGLVLTGGGEDVSSPAFRAAALAGAAGALVAGSCGWLLIEGKRK